ncbi:MAG: NUDIX domain-containing protein [Patescibacteria group bacterium]
MSYGEVMLEEKILLHATLVFLMKPKKILMAKKARKIGAGLWNGYGGGINEGEDSRVAAVRELEEESSLHTDPKDLEKVALIDFYNTKTDGTKFICRVHVYFATIWSGGVKETEEMLQPTWFYLDKLPLDEMMPADREWLPPLLAGKKIIAKAYYGPFQKELLGVVEIKEVASFD